MAYTLKINLLTYLEIQIFNLLILLEKFLILEKSHRVYLKPEGETCNYLKLGSKICIIKRKGKWTHISWRNGKKKGWVKLFSNVK